MLASSLLDLLSAQSAFNLSERSRHGSSPRHLCLSLSNDFPWNHKSLHISLKILLPIGFQATSDERAESRFCLSPTASVICMSFLGLPSLHLLLAIPIICYLA